MNVKHEWVFVVLVGVAGGTIAWLVGIVLTFEGVSLNKKYAQPKVDKIAVLEKQVAQNKADIEGIVDLLETQKKTWQMQHEFNEATNTRINQLRAVSQ